MTLLEALKLHFAGLSAVNNLIAGRFYPKRLPKVPAYPSIVAHRISAPREHSMDGPSGLVHVRYTIVGYAKTFKAAQDLSTQVRLALDGYKGTMGGAGGVEVNGAFLEDDDGDGYDDVLELYWWSMDFIIHHNEATS